MSMQRLVVFLALSGACGCMSTKVGLSPKWDPAAKPAYEDYLDAYVLGFVGEPPTLNLQQVCVDQKPLGVQRVISAEDAAIRVFTLGIYAPSTVRVWCGD